MLHVRVNRKLCYTCRAIDSSKIKVPGFWGEALMPSEKKNCVDVLHFLREFQWEILTLLELIWSGKFMNLRRNTHRLPCLVFQEIILTTPVQQG